MTIKQALIAARVLIAKKSRWIKGFMAFNKQNRGVDATSLEACKFCVLGAIRHVAGEWSPLEERCRERLESVIGDGFIATFNDNHTHAQVLAVFDKAIEGCR